MGKVGLTVVFFISLSAPCIVIAEEPVAFKDPRLKAVVEEALGVMEPTPTDMLSLVSLNAGYRTIEDLGGLEYALNLEELILNDNRIRDLDPLSVLHKLRRLDVSDNHVLVDLSGISGLVGLEQLDLHQNMITDVGPLSGLVSLKRLVLRNNLISDISSLGSLSALEELVLRENNIIEISGLVGLRNLKLLDLSGNPLGEEAYCEDLWRICQDNPGLYPWYDPNPRGPSWVQASDGTYADRVRITWTEVCQGLLMTSRYRVYRGLSLDGAKEAISGWQFELSYDDTTAQPGLKYYYWVQADPYGDGSGAGQFSDPNVGWARGSTQGAGGDLSLVYVDDDGLADPGPMDPCLSDPLEDGSREHPFDSIQEAIERAVPGGLVLIRPGLYIEDIDDLGKGLNILGYDPNNGQLEDLPILVGCGPGPVVRIGKEGTSSRLTGLIIRGGDKPCSQLLRIDGGLSLVSHCIIAGYLANGDDGSAIVCNKSVVTFEFCTVVDNRCSGSGAAIALSNSAVKLVNSIVWGNTPLGILRQSGTLEARYSNIQGLWSGQAIQALDPLFARSGAWDDQLFMIGDYHLRSSGGRWDPTLGIWVLDPVTSPCIDAGDPGYPIGNESHPNGNRVNMGAYGQTIRASRSHVASDGPVAFKDPRLKAAVEEALGVVDPTQADMLGLVSLSAGYRMIEDLSGLEYALNLEELILNDNRIRDLGPLSVLHKLRRLDVSDNYVLSDLRGISGLVGLEDLDLHRNSISDIDSLSGLVGLRRLVLRNNGLKDIDGLVSLASLNEVNLRENNISQISGLVGLKNLKLLDLSGNPLGEEAYCEDLWRICQDNPGLYPWYDPNPRGPSWVQASDGTYADRVRITWTEVCQGPLMTSRYRVYRGLSLDGAKEAISGWQFELSYDDTTAQPGLKYYYWVQADPYGDGSGQFSTPDMGWR